MVLLQLALTAGTHRWDFADYSIAVTCMYRSVCFHVKKKKNELTEPSTIGVLDPLWEGLALAMANSDVSSDGSLLVSVSIVHRVELHVYSWSWSWDLRSAD